MANQKISKINVDGELSYKLGLYCAWQELTKKELIDKLLKEFLELNPLPPVMKRQI